MRQSVSTSGDLAVVFRRGVVLEIGLRSEDALLYRDSSSIGLDEAAGKIAAARDGAECAGTYVPIG
jgi:hypothetical protein